jgi:hypothetical protein
MLVTCPDCGQKVSDRARACPGCGFPIAEHLAEQVLADALATCRTSRTVLGEVDCVPCEARGFRTIPATPDAPALFEWCSVCEHTGRVTRVRSSRGWFAVARLEVERFVGGARDEDGVLVRFLGPTEPPPHRYPKPGERFE